MSSDSVPNSGDSSGKALRKLKSYERTIDQLLSSLHWPSAILKEKLAQAEEVVATLGESLGEAEVESWNGKIANWWERFAAYESGHPTGRGGRHEGENGLPDAFGRMLSVSPSKSGNSFRPLEERPNEELGLSAAQSRIPTQVFRSHSRPPPPPPLTDALAPALSPDRTNSLLIQKTKAAIRSEMKREFEQLDLSHQLAPGDPTSRLAQLAEVVERARSLTLSFWEDNRLQMDIFDFAFERLPAEQATNYALLVDPTGRKKCLRDLRRYLQMQVRLTQDARAWIDAAFATLPENPPNETEHLKSLLVLLNRAASLVFPFDGATAEAIFDRAYVHLSAEKRAALGHAFPGGPKKSLRNLRKFLDDEIVYTYYKRHAEETGQLEPMPGSPLGTWAAIERALEQIPPMTTSGDISNLRRLFDLVCKARLAVSPHRQDHPLQEAVFGVAFGKLPIQMRAAYGLGLKGEEYRTLLELSKFLVGQIHAYYSEEYFGQKAKMEVHQEGDGARPVTPAIQQPLALIYCRYCKRVGTHTWGNCPEMNSLTCYKCFKQGHKAKNCALFETLRVTSSGASSGAIHLRPFATLSVETPPSTPPNTTSSSISTLTPASSARETAAEESPEDDSPGEDSPEESHSEEEEESDYSGTSSTPTDG